MRPIHHLQRTSAPVWSRVSGRICTLASTLILTGGLTTGCLEVEGESPFESMCELDTDCDGGEYCDEDICWGDPPDGHYAARLLPPGGSDDLAITEIAKLEIDANGDVHNLIFAPSVTVTGRVALSCDMALPDPGCVEPVAIEAIIQIRGPSSIAGRPFYTRSEVSRAEDANSAPSFSIALPVSDEPYEITVVPSASESNSTAADLAPGELAPPITFFLAVTGDVSLDDQLWLVGEPENYLVVEGNVVDALGEGLQGMKVEAQLSDRSSRRVSSLGFTDDEGHFTLRVPRGLEETVDIVAAPTAGMNVPTLRSLDVAVSELVPPELVLLEMPSHGDPAPFVLPIEGTDGSGDTSAVSGATVRAVTELSEPDASLVATYTTGATTDDRGLARLMLIPGSQVENRDYTITVQPTNTSEHSAVSDQAISIGRNDGGTLAAVSLGRRVSVSGLIREADGREADGAAIEVRLAGRFLDPLDTEIRVQASNVPLPKASSIPNGRFQVWLDETRLGLPALYDIDVRSGSIIGAPLSIHDVDVSEREEGSNSFEFGDIQLPDASYARGTVTGPDGTIIPEARVEVFVVNPACVVEDPEQKCTAPRELGVRPGEEDGGVMLILPHPDPITTTTPPPLETVE